MAKKILLIEDDELLRGLIKAKFSKEGYRILQAVDGPSGLKTAQDELPDLILLDIILPGMTGFEVLEKLKQDKVLAKIPVMILSNLWQKSDIEKGLKLGAADYLIKVNFVSEEILEKIKHILK